MGRFDFLFNDNKRGHKFSGRWLRCNNESFYNEVIEFSIKNNLIINFNAKIWHLINNEIQVPKCYCGNNLKFISVTQGYSIFCSNKCSSNSKTTQEKTKKTNKLKYGSEYYTQTDEYLVKTSETNIIKYGHEFSTQSEDIKNKIKKTNLKKHGFESIFSSDEVKDKIKATKKLKYNNETFNNPTKISDSLSLKYQDKNELEEFLSKQKKTNLSRYGNEYANKTPKIKEKNKLNTEKSIILKYGVDNVFKLKNVQDKISLNNYTLFKSRYPDLIFNEYNIGYHNITCVKCGDFNINSSLLYTRYRDKNEICTNCNPIGDSISISESAVFKYISEIYSGEIYKNRRDILEGKELDIYIPEHNIAIEYNGLYWHNELYKDKNYHLNKTQECEAKGIQLIHIFEDEWLYKQDIVKSRLRNILGLTLNKIYARKCIIKEVGTKDKNDFLDINHIQGDVKSSINLGLYYNNELISLMAFLNEKNIINLVRFCNKLDMSIVGGASKLFNHFIKTHTPNKVISFSDKRWSQGDLYLNLKFKFESDTPPSYWYVIGDERFHKFNFRKNRKNMVSFDQTKTEHQIMLDRKIYRIYDCGLKKWYYENTL